MDVSSNKIQRKLDFTHNYIHYIKQNYEVIPAHCLIETKERYLILLRIFVLIFSKYFISSYVIMALSRPKHILTYN